MFIIILFVLPTVLILTDAKITITVKVNSSKIDTDIKYSGIDYKPVTNQELHIFNVTTAKLNKGMRVYMGKVPNDIFIRDPTEYGNLFEKYKWDPVKRKLTVNKAKVKDILSEDIVLKTHEHINNSSTVLKSKRSLYESVENTAQSSWVINGIPSDDIYYDIELAFGYDKFKYENKWRDEKYHITKMLIGETKEGEISIKPSQTVVTKLIVTKTILIIELEYKAELVGAAVANYAELYGKYHFWAPSIQSIMKAAEMKNEILTKEQIKVRCFINPRLDVRDKATGEIVEPPKIRRPLFRILRNKKVNRILYTKVKKPEKKKQQKKKKK